ncbi:MAG: hypothetical protein PWP59_1674 [Sphaerochaeta sp.]|nr:hypothetical protein [Sphaerochaeta sp.]
MHYEVLENLFCNWLERLLIVDGFQRIITVNDYVKGIFNVDGKVFRLTDSDKINRRWRGKSFNELSDVEQRRIKNTTIHAIIFSQKKPLGNNTGMYQIFERINTSGRTLFPQEIRNSVYQNKEINKLLIELNNYKTWRLLFGSKKFDSRMRDIEFILRFFALRDVYLNPPPTTMISLKKCLNDFMGEDINNTPERLSFLRELFKTSIDCVFSSLGSSAFHNLSHQGFSTKFNPTIFDSIVIAVSFENDSEKLSNLKSHHLDLLENQDYQDLIKIRTTNTLNIISRIDMVKKYMNENIED